jgi:hypothetical protein
MTKRTLAYAKHYSARVWRESHPPMMVQGLGLE